VEAQAEALLAAVDENVPVNFRLCDVTTEIQSLKFAMANGLMAFKKNISGIFQEDLLCI
jgi:hypothetical protein